MIGALDHVNLRTARLDEMVAWYGRILGLHPGPRPDFGFPGAWLYAGEAAIVHLVAVEGDGGGPDRAALRMEHFALSASGLQGFLDRLEAEGVPYRPAHVPPGVVDVVQINIHDPDGNHIHVDFPGEEARQAGL